jgi:uncharacterized protein YidB (DUF937 family)
MGMLDGLLGGIVGAGMVSVVNSIIEKHGQAVDKLTPNGAIPKA